MTQGNRELNLEANVVFGNDTQLVGNTSLSDKKKISQGSCIIIHSTSAYLFSVLFLCFVVFFFQFSQSSFFMVSHDLRLCFLELVHFFRSANLYSLVHPHFLDVRGVNNWDKNQNGGGRDVFRRQSCINNRYILSF